MPNFSQGDENCVLCNERVDGFREEHKGESPPYAHVGPCPFVAAKVKAAEEAARTKAIKEVAAWISSMASGMFGSTSWGLRKQLADVIAGRLWETTLKNEKMRP